jgi:hypothetical protein
VAWKTLTPLNWRDTDPVLAVYAQMGADGTPSSMTADDWAQSVLAVQLAPTAPQNTRSLFDVARGSMLYGSLFYPLFALGLEGVYRAADAATAEACTQRNLVPTSDRFVHRLNALKDAGVLSSMEHDRWRTLRRLRNKASHPEKPTILPPGKGLALLRQIADDINALFP